MGGRGNPSEGLDFLPSCRGRADFFSPLLRGVTGLMGGQEGLGCKMVGCGGVQ